MAEASYPEMEEHQVLHRRLTKRVMELNKEKNFVFSSVIWDFLENWLTEHILVADKSFAKFLREQKS